MTGGVAPAAGVVGRGWVASAVVAVPMLDLEEIQRHRRLVSSEPSLARCTGGDWVVGMIEGEGTHRLSNGFDGTGPPLAAWPVTVADAADALADDDE